MDVVDGGGGLEGRGGGGLLGRDWLEGKGGGVGGKGGGGRVYIYI